MLDAVSLDHVGGVKNYATREALFEKHADVAVQIAFRFAARLPKWSILDSDDLRSVALQALWRCTEVFDPDNAARATFLSFARQRLFGAMVDELRKMDMVPRSVRNQQKYVASKRRNLNQSYGREVREQELQEHLHEQGFHHEDDAFHSVRFVSLQTCVGSHEGDESFESRLPDENASDPSTAWESEADAYCLEECLERLLPLERGVIRIYYWSGVSLADIARGMGVTESWVCQIISTAQQKLRQVILEIQEREGEGKVK